MVYAMKIQGVNYMVYDDGGELWLRIRHENADVSASISVDCMCELLLHHGKIKLDGKKSDAKTLAFDSSRHLHDDEYKVNTFLTCEVPSLLNMLLSTPKIGSYRIRSETSINNELIRRYERGPSSKIPWIYN